MENKSEKNGCLSKIIGLIIIGVIFAFINSAMSSKTVPMAAEYKNEYSCVTAHSLYAMHSDDGFDYIDVNILFGSRNDEVPVAFGETYGIRFYENGVEQQLLDVSDNFNEKLSESSGKTMYICPDKDENNNSKKVKLFDVHACYNANNIDSKFTVEIYDLNSGEVVITKDMQASKEYYEN